MSFDFETCRSKDELEAQAKALFGVDLDKRKKLDELKNEFRALIEGADKDGDASNAVPAEDADLPEKKAGSHVKNKKGVVFPYHPLLKKRLGDDLTLCDKDGTPV